MTARTMKAALVEQYPDPPEGWLPFAFTDKSGAWVRGLAEIEADAADTSGPRKALALVKADTWSHHLVGGSVHTWRQRLANAQRHLFEIQSRIEALARQGRDTTQTQGEIAVAEKEIVRWSDLIEAAEVWAGIDNVTLRQRAEEKTQDYKGMVDRLVPYRRAGLPAPEGWEAAAYSGEVALAKASAAFAEGRKKFDALSESVARTTGQAHQALAGGLRNVISRIAAQCRGLVPDENMDFLASFPGRAPDALIAHYKRAQRVAALLDNMGDPEGRELFWRLLTEPIAGIVGAKIGAGVTIHPEARMRPIEPHPDALMGSRF